MNGRTRTLLALAMSTALIAPVAFAQTVKTEVKTTGNVTATQPSLAPQVVQRAVDATVDVTKQRPTQRAADAVDARVAPVARLPVHTGNDQAAKDVKAKDAVENKEIPPTAQGAAHAAGHSSIVQRDVWVRLDADADGRISATEADADATFDGNFAAIDANKDGFVSDVEYRTFAKVDTSQGAGNAASHSSVVQRATWSRLDTDADGRISAVEADADAGTDGSFSAIDSNSDGFITDAEFRAHAKAISKP